MNFSGLHRYTKDSAYRPRTVSRREFLAGSALAVTGFSSAKIFAQSDMRDAVVRTPLGELRGVSQAGVRVFEGVPFAEPPVGPLRFRATKAPQAWKGVRDARSFAASPMQTGEKGVAHSEDCLYLNIWAPEGKGPFPVFVWIHGGAFTGGHSFEAIYDDTQFAREGIVCITVGYRLGVFGFLDFETVLGPEYADSANNGIRDIIAALEWIRGSVANFGGDPGRVTIGGESAGAKLSDMLLGIPSATDLFHQVISESGGAERLWPRTTSGDVAQGFLKTWEKNTSKNAAALVTEPAESLIPVQNQFIEEWPQHFPLRSESGGALMKHLPIQAVAAGLSRGKRLLIGTNRDESALFLGPHPQHDPTAQNLGNMGLSSFMNSYNHYKNVYPEMPDEQRRIRAVTAEEYWVPSVRLANAHVEAGGKAWMYELNFSESGGLYSGQAYHSLDVGLVWDKPHTNIANAAAEAAMASEMHDAWVAFIRGEEPAAKGLPAWPMYNADTQATMMLDSKSEVKERPQEAEYRLWDGKL